MERWTDVLIKVIVHRDSVVGYSSRLRAPSRLLASCVIFLLTVSSVACTDETEECEYFTFHVYTRREDRLIFSHASCRSLFVAAVGGKYCDQRVCVLVFVCRLSVRSHFSIATCPNVTKFSEYVTCGRGLVLL